MTKYEIWVNNKFKGYIWAADEFDAIWRASKRYGIPSTIIQAYEMRVAD